MSVPENFDFPFTPYSIQHDFMRNLYITVQNKQLGIFESPTGTGKSLSILCGILRWLRDHNEEERNRLKIQIETLENEKVKLIAESNDWLNSQSREIELTHNLNKLKLDQNRINEYDKKIEKLYKKKRKESIKYVRDNVVKNKIECEEGAENDVESVEDDILIKDVVADFNAESSDSDDDDDNSYQPVKILICSRTHSQLSQLVGEILKSPFGDQTRAVSLASRQNYCINPTVVKLKNNSLINERCLDMQNKSTKTTKTASEGKALKHRKLSSSSQCPYNKQQNIEDLRDLALIEIRDVEDLVFQGIQLKACPYYASRKAVEDAQIVLVPYNTLLHKSTREASGIKLKNNVVIIDEAHNLLEALAQMYSAEINCVQLEEARVRLCAYKEKYSTRFSAYNLLCINQLLFVISSLINMLCKNTNTISGEIKSEVYTVQNFVLNAEIDNYNMFRLIKFCKDSKIAQKIHSFSTTYPAELQTPTKKPERSSRTGIQQFLASIENKKSAEQVVPTENEDNAKLFIVLGNPFLTFTAFLEALTYSYGDGRIILYSSSQKKESKLHFLLLNPAEQFKDIVKDARSVIVAGGTMKPTLEFRERLFQSAGANPNQIVEFSYDHIIPPQNVLPLIITKGVNQENLLFNFENRFKMGESLKAVIQKVSEIVTGGIVVFFPSYSYEAWFYQQIKGVDLARPLFREPQNSGSVDSVLNSYATAIRKPNSVGAMLFSVVGGKLSEGLNFSDDLGRCVIVVGLPYANINSPELKEKMIYLDNQEGQGAGKTFYENLCMKSVNQCIGRAVRHRNDYASILLLDTRYDRIGTKDALPGWIKCSLITCDFNQATNAVRKFFQERSSDK